MALRMAVNDELGELEAGLGEAVRRLRPGGLLAAISFHSKEDGIVKRFTRESMEPLTKKPIRPTVGEVHANPRARSARLRIARRRAG
jgi:16S rRNA (cytosine1402-N4)-methyltransferase